MFQDYIRKNLSVALCVLCLSFSCSVFAKKEPSGAPDFKEGKHYVVIPETALKNKTVQDFLIRDSKKIQILNFFSYGCYGCSLINTPLNTWTKKNRKKISFYRIPVVFHPSWRMLAKIYYVLDELERLNQFEEPLFQAIHRQRTNLSTKLKLKEFLTIKGLKSDQFDKLIDSFLIEQRVVYALNLAKCYEIKISPSIVMNTPKGSFLTNFYMVKNEEELLSLMGFLMIEYS